MPVKPDRCLESILLVRQRAPGLEAIGGLDHATAESRCFQATLAIVLVHVIGETVQNEVVRIKHVTLEPVGVTSAVDHQHTVRR